MVTLLVTGFGPFPGAPNNPSAQLVAALDARRLARLDVRLESAILPVVFSGADTRLNALIEMHRPDGILHIGLAGRRKNLGVEMRARNRHSIFHADAMRQMPAARHVVQGGEDFRPSRLPLARAVAALHAQGARAEISIDAGRYACNQTLYLTLGKTATLAGFIHIPRPSENLPLANMVAGVESVLIDMAKLLRRQCEVARMPCGATGSARQSFRPDS